MQEIWSQRYISPVQELAKLETDHPPVAFLLSSVLEERPTSTDGFDRYSKMTLLCSISWIMYGSSEKYTHSHSNACIGRNHNTIDCTS